MSETLATQAADAMRPRPGSPPVSWAVSSSPIGYEAAKDAMEARAADIAVGRAPEVVWLLEHPPLLTAGASAHDRDLVDPGRFPIYRTNRGGQFTYHGPGQRVCYVMLDLARRRQDVRAYVRALEAWLIATLAALGVAGERREGRVGVWVRRGTDAGAEREDKIAAIGVRVRRWVTFHGVALNVDPDLAHFDAIVPCGVREHGVTSLVDLGRRAAMGIVDAALRRQFETLFGPTIDELPLAAPDRAAVTAGAQPGTRWQAP